MYIPLTFEGALAKCLYASGGYEGYFTSGSDEYRYHLFTTGSSTFNVLAGTLDNVSMLVVGGGGAGGTSTVGSQGGGGGEVKSFTNLRLFSGTYNITIGEGGLGQIGSLSKIGGNGFTSSFSGSNLFITASGGGGGGYYGNSTGTGVSGNGFAGGTPTSQYGGGGGGATSAGRPGQATATGSNGGSGVSYNIVNDSRTWGYGCGGGGNAVTSVSNQYVGSSCNGAYFGYGGYGVSGNQGADGYGMGGGGGFASSTTGGGDGGNGAVYIQYKINSYCKNYTLNPGNCGCRGITFNATTGPTLSPNTSASYFYVPCGTSKLISGSVLSGESIFVCATSGTFYAGPTDYNDIQIGYINGGVGVACSTGSVCGAIPLYTSSCSSSIYTYFGSLYTHYVARNSNTSSYFVVDGGTTSGSVIGKYICQSSILTNPSGSSPIANSTIYAQSSDNLRFNGATCLVLNTQRTIATGGNTYTQTLNYWDEFGAFRQVTKTYNDANPTWNLTFTASFANGSPYFTSATVSPNAITYVMQGNAYTSSGLPTCGCP